LNYSTGALEDDLFADMETELKNGID